MPSSPSVPAGLEQGFRHIAAHVESAVRDLSCMVAVDTSFPPGQGYAAFARLMEALVAPLRLETRRVSVPEALWRVPGGPACGERVNLIATRRSGRPVLGLYFHTDTVPPAEGWTTDPFHLTRVGEKLHGLGAADMKGSIAATLLALRAAESCAIPLAYDPQLLLCTDEEGGLYPGVRYLAEQGLVEGHVLNFNGSAGPRIWSGCFGVFNLLVRITGRTTHAGDAAGAVNAVEAGLPVLNALAALKPVVAERRSTLPPPPWWEGRPLAASLSIAAVRGGTGSGGQVPASFEITLNRRYPPEESYEAARAEIEATIRAALPPGAGAEILLVGHLMPTADPYGPHWPRWQAALSQGFGYRPEEFRVWGASSCSDFGWVQQATGRSEVLLTGLGRAENAIHAPGEYTTPGDIVALAQSVLAYLAADFAPALIPPADRAA
ncbi:M20/M25/M40 family metallo-hydrolase [Roseomonas sp. GC11]|uniref:M20 family metallopeptidase n=1 Tax=Roseomonas sp. GC11 TaxID=2950546 RepID=UPI00210D5A4F|nr:M20/M25/M40 family metallo-hydrolase [Roseomonas sp. GC11]MCQ4160061.1 M20/M25/M40 family metallo-hydrolase [Roseomonas sp. GC11]